MAWYYILLLVILSLSLFILLLYFILPYILVHYLSYPRRYDNETALSVDKKKGLLPDVDQMERIKVEFQMPDGYIIHGDITRNNLKKFVIFAHGYTWTREGQLKYAQIYQRLGYSIVLYDERSHGENIHNDVTMGYKEAEDLHCIIRFIYEKYGADIQLGIMGESMGGATVLQVLKYHDPLEFVHADCPYSSLRELFSYKLKTMYMPQFLLKPIDHIIKRKHGYHIDDVNPEKYVKESDIPLLLTTGHEDDFVPFIQCQHLYDAKEKGYKELHFFDGARHAKSLEKHPQKYEEVVKSFLRKIAQI